MDTDNLNIDAWLPQNAPTAPPLTFYEKPELDTNIETDIERVVQEIERTHTDLTKDYDDWIKIGFSFANELGEMGRSYFHRVSKIFPKYSLTDTDKKYDNCLKSDAGGTKINTFFYLAKSAGIDISKEKKKPAELPKTVSNPEADSVSEPEDRGFVTPLLPSSVFENLPKILKESCSLFPQGIEQDILLMSAITVISGCLPNIEGIYFNRSLSAHLYLFIVGPSASGKGTMVWSRNFAQAIHEEMFRATLAAQEVYKKELDDYESLPKNQKTGMSKPEPPPRKMFFIPANSSSAALTQLLAENNFRGIIFESEADTISNTAKQDWGDSSDIFRKAFHHENTSMARRTNREMIEITNPHIAMCISGTPNQVHHLMPDVENGLFSRYMYYAFQDTRGFLNPFVSHQDTNYQAFFTQKSYEILSFYEKLMKLIVPIKFKLTEKQAAFFTSFFQSLLDKNKLLLAKDLDANTKRLGVITFRIAMVFTALRLMEAEIGNKIKTTIYCSDIDFENAITIATTLEAHAIAIYQSMPKIAIKGRRLTFFERLPKKFNRKDYLKVGKELGISNRTADNYISLFKEKLLDSQYNDFTKREIV